MENAFYRREGDVFGSSLLTRGPWDPGAQHAGPPTALLATVVEERHPSPELQIARITVEINRPVPIVPLTVATRELRAGRNVALYQATLSAGGRELMSATVLRMRATSLPLESNRAPAPARRDGPPAPFFPTGMDVGYHTGVEWSFVEGSFLDPGPAVVWMRMRQPLIAGEATRPVARVLVLADAANGVASQLDYTRWLFVNADLTVNLHRLPAGEWIALDARTTVEPHGIGLCESRLFDEGGAIGRSAQCLFLAAR